jgi:hypothetical protein
MSEPNNGQDPFANRIVTSAPKLKRHNSKLCPLVILAAGDSKRSIAKTLRVSNNTVTAVAEQHWQQVETRKARIAAQAERAATRAFDRINYKLDSPDDIPLNILVPVAGVSVDKLIALRGDPSIVARIEHAHTGNIFEAFQRFHDDVRKEIGARVKADYPSMAQLALPNS